MIGKLFMGRIEWMNANMYMAMFLLEVDIMLVYHPLEIINKKHANI